MTTTDRDLGLKEILKEVETFKGKTVKVGIQDDGETHDESDETLAQIAFVNEFGIQRGQNRVRARPAHRQAFEKNRKQIEFRFERFYQGVLDRKIKAPRALALLGEWYQNEVRESVNRLKAPKNAPLTIERKKSSNPLVDTGQTRQSIRWIIE